MTKLAACVMADITQGGAYEKLKTTIICGSDFISGTCLPPAGAAKRPERMRFEPKTPMQNLALF